MAFLALGDDRCRFLAMHRDKPPGIFDLGDRSMRYAAGFCFVVGFLVSVLVRVGVALAGGHFFHATPRAGFLAAGNPLPLLSPQKKFPVLFLFTANLGA